MKIEVGKKYRMRSYINDYLYVQILGKVKDILPKDNSEEFYGVIVFRSSITGTPSFDPSILSWGEDGSWDGMFPQDSNSLVYEVGKE